MTQRKPGDYVINAELTDEQRERFVQDCVAAGVDRIFEDCQSHKYTSLMRPLANLVVGTTFLEGGSNAYWKGYSKNVTHEYKDNPMNQADLMEQIAAAMRRNPDGWWREFEILFDGEWIECTGREALHYAMCYSHKVRPKPRTYTLHIEDMPEPMREEPEEGEEYWLIDLMEDEPISRRWKNSWVHRGWLGEGLCYPDKQSAQQAMDKLKAAMGASND